MTLNIPVLEQTFGLIEPRASEFAASFYETLFTDCPEARPLFANTDMDQQKKKLIMSLVYVVGNLRYPDNLVSKLKDLGAKHVTYGAASVHYPIVGAALLKTLEEYLGSNWTSEVQQAWLSAYEAIASIMIEGAKEYELTQQAAQPNQQSPQSLSSQTESSQDPPHGSNWKQPLIAFGVIGLLLAGYWFYVSQTKTNNQSSPRSSMELNIGRLTVLG